MQLILLLSGLYVYQNHLTSSGVIEEVGVDESVANATAVYITNRYYQRVITAPDAVRVVERTGANWCHLITFTNYFQTS